VVELPATAGNAECLKMLVFGEHSVHEYLASTSLTSKSHTSIIHPYAGMPMTWRLMLRDRVPVVLNLITPSTREVVTDVITTLTSFPTGVLPVLTGVATAIGAYLKSAE
jgi:hypothetical protein